MVKFDAFISYPHQNKAVADAACAMVEAAGIRCWIAPRDVEPGAEWAGAIVDAIDHCSVMILIFSSHANESKQVRREVQRAFDGDVPVVPLRVENVMPEKSLAYYMGPVHWLDALTPPLEQHLQKLVGSVKALVDARRANPAGAVAPPIAPDLVPSVLTADEPGAADRAVTWDSLADREVEEARRREAEETERRRQEEDERRRQEQDRARQAEEQARRAEEQRLAQEQQQRREAARRAEEERREQARRMAEEAQRQRAPQAAPDQAQPAPAATSGRTKRRGLWPASTVGRIVLGAVALLLCGLLAIAGNAGYREWRNWRDSPTLVIRGSLGTVASAAFSPDGRRLVSASTRYYTDCASYRVETCKNHVAPDVGVRVWDATTGISVLSLDQPDAWHATFSPDGKWIAASSDQGIKVWDANGQLVRTLSKGVSRAVFSPDSLTIAASDGNIWSVATGKLVRKLSDDCSLPSGFSPDGRRLATIASTKTKAAVCDVQTGQMLTDLKGIFSGHQVYFLPDGKRVITSGAELYDAATGKLIRRLESGSHVAVGAKWVAFSSSSELRVLDAESLSADGSRRLYSPQDYSPDLALSPDGKRLAAVGTVIEIWNLP